MRRRLLLAAGAVAVCLAGAAGLAWHAVASLPPLDLAAAEARSVVVLDRDGRLLRPFATPEGRWRLPLAPADVDPRYLAMLTAYEDARFARHPGVDPFSLARAGWQWLRAGRVVSGASTLSMQVARLVEPRTARSLRAKLRQMGRAIALEREFGKDGILRLYFALAPFGGPVEGVRAASLSYFGREPNRLTTAEIALLVALPQAPEARRPDRHPGAARRARDRVLARAVAAGIVASEEARDAAHEPVLVRRADFPMLAAHAAERALAEAPGLAVHRLTIDGRLQGVLEGLARDALARQPGLSAAILVVDNATGEVRARVGSAGYLDATRAGAIDMTTAVRSPGSALKPFIYGQAFDLGLAHPETLIEDRPARFGGYAPQNFDLAYQGTVTARRALQLSLNVPAVELLDAVGAARFIARLRATGAALTLPRDTPPGLPVALGGLGISLADLARLYAGIARGGGVPALVERRDDTGTEREGSRVCEPVACWYVADTLRGAPPPDVALAGRIAFKTGTSYGYRDAWAVGFDRRVTIAVWIGRPDGGPVPGLVGRRIAAPILFDAFARYGGEPEAVARPPGVLVASTGALPPPLRRLRKDGLRAVAATGEAPLRISFPPEGARIDLGFAAGSTRDSDLALKAVGGKPPFVWMVDNVPVATAERRQAGWHPAGAGFTRIAVIDSNGESDSVLIFLE